MRKLEDAEGGRWEVVVGRESFGAMVLLFVPDDADGRVRQTPLRAESYAAALSELHDMDEAALREQLERAVPKAS